MILSYSIISSILLVCGFLVYRLTMAGERQHALNRQTILTLYAVSLLLPLAMLAVMLRHPDAMIGFQNASPGPQIELGEMTGGLLDGEGIQAGGITGFAETVRIVYMIYAVGVIVIAAYFIFGILMLGRVIKKGERTEFGTFTLIIVDDDCKTSPFNWGRSIVMARRDYEEDSDMILLHEHAHLRHRHWADLILAYATICFQWYNPAAWAMREQLKEIHEYQADESVLETGTDAKEYQMMLLKKAAGNGYQSLANSLIHSKLQKRVTMMYKKKTSAKRRLFALALIPAIGAGIAVTSIPAVAGVLESITEVPSASPVSQAPAVSDEVASDKVVFVAVEDMPEFPGGMPALNDWLGNHIVYPEAAEKNDIQGRVIVKFVVEADGIVTNPKVVRGASPELDAEALRVVGEMPKWTPGKNNGVPVACYFTIPITFRLKDDSKAVTAQVPEKKYVPKADDIFVAVEDQAEFPGGMPALMEWLGSHINYPEKAQKEEIEGRVIVKFVIEADGTVDKPQVVRGVSPELDNEAIRLIVEMPKWEPGRCNGVAVASYFTIPINFRLKKDSKEETSK